MNRVVRQFMVVSQAAMKPNQEYGEVALFGTDGAPVSVTAFTGTGATVPMTGYAGHAAGNVAAADTLNDAVGKLEARVLALETLIALHVTELADHESRLDVLEA